MLPRPSHMMVSAWAHPRGWVDLRVAAHCNIFDEDGCYCSSFDVLDWPVYPIQLGCAYWIGLHIKDESFECKILRTVDFKEDCQGGREKGRVQIAQRVLAEFWLSKWQGKKGGEGEGGIEGLGRGRERGLGGEGREGGKGDVEEGQNLIGGGYTTITVVQCNVHVVPPDQQADHLVTPREKLG
jgi:hypothetical protein